MRHLTLEQKYKIEAMLCAGFKQEEIAKEIGKDKSVVSREIKRNKDQRNGEYRANLAIRKTAARHSNKNKYIRFTEEVKELVEQGLKKDYSPEQIVGCWKKEGLSFVSIERIYQYVWEDKRRGGTLYKHLRTKGKRYRKRGKSKDSRGLLKDRVNIEERPAIVEEKTRFGDLEIDTIIGKGHQGAIVTINSRASGILWMKKVERRTAELVAAAAIELLLPFKELLFTITADNGKEFAGHKEIAAALGIDFYFANPYSSWERGANENLNGLVRQYIPKKTDFLPLSDAYISEIQLKLNQRPRKRFGFKSPHEVMQDIIQDNSVAFMT